VTGAVSGEPAAIVLNGHVRRKNGVANKATKRTLELKREKNCMTTSALVNSDNQEKNEVPWGKNRKKYSSSF